MADMRAVAKDITDAVVGVLAADQDLPMSKTAIQGAVREAGSTASWPQLNQALERLVADGVVLAFRGADIHWEFPGKSNFRTYYMQQELHARQRNQIAEGAAKAADLELRRRHQDEWQQLFDAEERRRAAIGRIGR